MLPSFFGPHVSSGALLTCHSILHSVCYERVAKNLHHTTSDEG
jgi:hypothetical protein